MKPWRLPRTHWKGRTVFVLGGGPSLIGFDFACLRGQSLIAINALGYRVLDIATASDILHGHDCGFFENHPELVKLWPGLITSTSTDAVNRYPGRILKIATLTNPNFLFDTHVKHGNSSGHTAISLAVALGATLIILLGFDMRLVNGRSHSHDFYVEQASVYRTAYIPAFRGWARAAARIGVRIVNATPGSSLHEFPIMRLEDIAL